MKTFFLFIGIAACAAACRSNESKTPEQEQPLQARDTTAAVPQSYAGCYQMIIGKDTADLQLTDSAGSYSGKLVYNRFEKDDNVGTVTLTPVRNELTGWYTFMSEGMESKRQIAFKTIDKNLAEGYGEIRVSKDTAFYKYPAALQFEEKHTFNKVNCK